MSVPRARLLDLMKVQCQVFATTFNPEGVRTGNKILRQRLKGPALASYYPRKVLTVRDVQKEFGPELTTIDLDEMDRLDHIAALKSRGKSAPKKLKAKGKTRRFGNG
ncbi:mitochondral 37s ribosomal protein [Colletotrichum karsti]|uniref:Small ribosomal subunit protein mS33 n=1 Tax=Colletotrichum karsti TaxID=1095194 RepID=A0A9P6I9M9_9PEZI|nr:mitochondral 37s ribosomal protein [Colletotrichum karsti]KAF9877721.1 mitochondral 37s ribosomal protein [Colletotrichum karsti]